MMELTVSKRQAGKKSETKKIRREGDIPAILYSKGKAGENLVVKGSEFEKILFHLEPGTLSTKTFALMQEGKQIPAILKDIQRHRTTYNILHLDFEELEEKIPVTVNVPIKLEGTMDCVGVKQGGAVRQVIRYLKVRCLPKDIPSHFELDVQNLEMGQAIKLFDLSIPETVRPVTNLKEVAVVIAKR